ncbi:hypothetical protein CDAR_563751 [Caerostris darwini]|uniref:Uncharacterized protein n=1 Tax=Caerostris darwini TaxID=1538125 RepID=A0AAV4VUT3_9ARAC|nr:hypothetical protein CDAR_563751 [Caerostris darwini]
MTLSPFRVSCNDEKRRTYPRARNISLLRLQQRLRFTEKKEEKKEHLLFQQQTPLIRKRVYGWQRHLNDPLLEEALFAGSPSPSRATPTCLFSLSSVILMYLYSHQ